MPRLAFGDFLDQDMPARGRGRGRGGARGGGGGGRGGRGGATVGGSGRGRGGIGFTVGGGRGAPRGRGGPSRGRGGSFGADYSNVPLDYNRVNGRGYARADQYLQFGPDPSEENTTTTKKRIPNTLVAPHTPHTPRTPAASTPASGTATPVGSGLGYHRNAKPKASATRVDKEGVTFWGGGAVPLFVKAGELFKEGEVDVVKRIGDTLVVETYSLADPSAPQMDDLRDDTEMDIGEGESPEEILGAIARSHHAHKSPVVPEEVQDTHDEQDESDDDAKLQAQLLRSEEDMDTLLAVPVVTQELSTVRITTTESYDVTPDVEVQTESATTVVIAETEVGADDNEEQDSEEDVDDSALFVIDTTGDIADTSADSDLFFIDTGAAPSAISVPVYEGPSSVPLGADRSPAVEGEEEAIVFKPRLITDPVTTAPNAAPRRPQTSNFELTNIYVDPRTSLSRKDRKAAKKAKRSRNKRTNRRNHIEGMPRDDSDLDWGSDGPPARILAVNGDDDMDALGTALAGTDLDIELGREADVDPDIDLAAMARFGGLAIGHDGDEMIEMDSDSDEWSEKDQPRREFNPADPWGVDEDESEEEDDDDDDDDLDETADFEALAAAYDTDSDEEDDDDGLFAGHQAWTAEDEEEAEQDEADWFLQSMEDALDGGVMSAGRKERKAVFKAIEQGSFDTALPTAPAPRKNKNPYVGTELADQWERDRQKKAEKKQMRELERVIGALTGKKKSRKGLRGVADAASIAHLIPKSAAEVAELFDIDSEEEDGGWKVAPQPRRNPLLPRTLEEVDAEIRYFLEDKGRTSLPLPPMDKESRKRVHMLAECYNLKSKSKGKGAARFPVLIKLSRSGLQNENKVQALLAASTASGGAFYKALYSRKKGGGGGGGGGSAAAGFARGTGGSTRAREGELVGEGAEKIGQDNVGHRLLSMMGWSEGSSIGRAGAGGLDVPIVAVVKNTKMGLGA